MQIIEITDRNESLIKQLVQIWQGSVKATHLFLTNNEIEEIKSYIPNALKKVPVLAVALNDKQIPIGFMGICKRHLEMLFVSDEARSKGVGKKLLSYGMEKYFVNDLAVNEQNPLAKGFYEHMGFRVYKRSEHDEQGRAYPILYMKR